MTQTNSFSRHVRVRALPSQSKIRIPRTRRGERSAERRVFIGAVPAKHGSAPCDRRQVYAVCALKSAKRARLPALHCSACRSDRTLRLSPGRASREREDAGVTAPPFALKRCTSRAGHNAGGDDARTARERGYKPRPQEPHSLHQSAVTGDAPRMSEVIGYVTETGTNVKPFVAAPVTCFRGRDEWEQTASQLCAK
jgi:hypothetical protein